MRILLLGAGEPQEHFIKYLHKAGHEVFLLTYDKKPIAAKYADRFFQKSTLDIEAVYQVAKEQRADRIIAVCTDQALHTMCVVSEMLGLPCYLSLEQVEKCTKKNSMKELLEKNGVKTAPYITVNSIQNFDEEKITFPVVVKPADCNSSKGVRKINNENELRNALDVALTLSRTDTAVIEKYINGRELTVDGFVKDGKFNLLLISEIKKTSVDGVDFLITGSETVSGIEPDVKREISSIFQRIVDALELSNSPFISQIIISDDGIYVVEFSARTGGGEKYRVIRDLTGVDVLDQVINILEEKSIEIEPSNNEEIYATTFLYGREGVIKQIVGFEELLEQGIISSYYIYKESGTVTLASIKSSGDRIAGFTVRGIDKNEINKKREIALSQVKIIDAQGQNMMLFMN